MRGRILDVLPSLFALLALPARRLGEPSPRQAPTQPVDALVLRWLTVATADGTREPDFAVASVLAGLVWNLRRPARRAHLASGERLLLTPHALAAGGGYPPHHEPAPRHR